MSLIMEAWRERGYAPPGSERMLQDYEDKLQMEQGRRDLIYALQYPPAPPPPPPPSPEDTRNEIYARIYPPSKGPAPPPELEDLSDGTLGVAGDVHAIRKVLDASGVEHYLPFRHNSIVIGLPDVAKARNALAGASWATGDEPDAKAGIPLNAEAISPDVPSQATGTELSMGNAQGLGLGGGTGLRFGGRRAGDVGAEGGSVGSPAVPAPALLPISVQAPGPASAPFDDGYSPQAKASIRGELALETGGELVNVGLQAPKTKAGWDATDVRGFSTHYAALAVEMQTIGALVQDGLLTPEQGQQAIMASPRTQMTLRRDFETAPPSAAGGSYLSPTEGDGRLPMQRYLESSAPLYASPLGAANYGLGKVLGLSEEKARLAGALGSVTEGVGGALSGLGLRPGRLIQSSGSRKASGVDGLPVDGSKGEAPTSGASRQQASVPKAIGPGSVKVLDGAFPDANELRGGHGLKENGYHVTFVPTASSQGIRNVRTADTIVAGVGKIDVYTPRGADSDNMVRVIEGKNKQAEGVVVQAEIAEADANLIAARVWGKPTAKNIKVLFFQAADGSILRIDRPKEGK